MEEAGRIAPSVLQGQQAPASMAKESLQVEIWEAENQEGIGESA